jgi:hypothetical protein
MTGASHNLVGGVKHLIGIALSYVGPPLIWAWAFFIFLLFPPFMIAFLWSLIEERKEPNFLTGGYERT